MVTFCSVVSVTCSVVFLIRRDVIEWLHWISLSTFCRIKPITLIFLHVLHVNQKLSQKIRINFASWRTLTTVVHGQMIIGLRRTVEYQ